MNPFAYHRATDEVEAIHELGPARSKYLGGGTNLIDLMKMGVETPTRLVDVNRLPLAEIRELPDGGLRLGALARNSDVASHPTVTRKYIGLSEALLSGASPQLRNRATVGGNLLQRTRCVYFYDPAFACCNKRNPGSGCGALEGQNRMHAILGQSDHCIAVHPSDMCVALAALEASVVLRSARGERTIAFEDFHLLPGEHPEIETCMQPDELITAVDLPRVPDGEVRSHYIKIRDRSSYAFALVSVGVVATIGRGRRLERVRIALGGVAHKPWRAFPAEEALAGAEISRDVFREAADRALAGAKGYQYNAFKIELARRTIVRALEEVTA